MALSCSAGAQQASDNPTTAQSHPESHTQRCRLDGAYNAHVVPRQQLCSPHHVAQGLADTHDLFWQHKATNRLTLNSAHGQVLVSFVLTCGNCVIRHQSSHSHGGHEAGAQDPALLIFPESAYNPKLTASG
eukprot:523877-Amphidinium_carterae.2